MPYAKKIVLHCPHGYDVRLGTLVEEFIRDGVTFVAVVGMDCSRIEDIIDALVVGDGSRDYDLLTSSHPDASVDEALAFARSLRLDYEGSELDLVVL